MDIYIYIYTWRIFRACSSKAMFRDSSPDWDMAFPTAFQRYIVSLERKNLLMNEEFAGRIVGFFRCGFVDIRRGARGKEKTQYDSVTVRFFHSANSSLFR